MTYNNTACDVLYLYANLLQSARTVNLLYSTLLFSCYSVYLKCFNLFRSPTTPQHLTPRARYASKYSRVDGFLQVDFNCTAYKYLSNTITPDIGDSLVANPE